MQAKPLLSSYLRPTELARYFGATPQFWMNLQSNYDLRLAEAKVGTRIKEEIATRPMVAA